MDIKAKIAEILEENAVSVEVAERFLALYDGALAAFTCCAGGHATTEVSVQRNVADGSMHVHMRPEGGKLFVKVGLEPTGEVIVRVHRHEAQVTSTAN